MRDETPLPVYPLRSLYLYLSGGCNLRCAHCWLSPEHISRKPDRERDQTGEIRAEDVKKLIRQARPLGLGRIKLSGGEPFLNPDILPIIREISDAEIPMDIESNGTLIDRGTARFLGEMRVEQVSISLDSSRPEYHDRFRGVKGAWEKALGGIRLMTAGGINVQIIMSLLADNAGDLENMIRLAGESGAASLKINPVMPVGRGQKLREQGKTLPLPKLLGLASWVEKELSSQYGIQGIFSLPSAFTPIRSFIRHAHSECRILNILGILHTGQISICGIGKAEPRLIMGNIREDDLAVLWAGHPLLTYLRENIPGKLKGICGRCILKGLCLGTCRAHAFVMSGDLAAPYWICQEAYEQGLFPKTRMLECA